MESSFSELFVGRSEHFTCPAFEGPFQTMVDVFICSEQEWGESLAEGSFGNLCPHGCRELPRNQLPAQQLFSRCLAMTGEMLEFRLYKKVCWRYHLSPAGPATSPRQWLWMKLAIWAFQCPLLPLSPLPTLPPGSFSLFWGHLPLICLRVTFCLVFYCLTLTPDRI